MEFDWRLRLAMVVGGVVLVGLMLAGKAWGDLDLEEVRDLLTGAGGLLAGIGIAGGRAKSVIPVLLMMALSGAVACSGSQQVDVARCSAAVLEAARDLAEACWPRSPEQSCSLDQEDE